MKKLNILIGMVLMILFFAIPSFAAGKVSVQGSTTVLPIIQIIAEEFMNQNPEVEITVGGGGSGVGISALLDGVCDIAMSSRKMKEEELQKGTSQGLSIQEFEIAKDAIAIVVNPSQSAIQGIDTATLKKIYTGEIKNWKDLGGTDKPLVVASRDTNSGTFETFKEKVLGSSELVPEALRLASNGAVLDEVSKNQEAMGYVGLGYVSKDVKALPLDGIKPTPETALSGQYPLSRSLYLYTPHGPEGATKQFIDFILSDPGQKIVADEGFVRVK